MRSLAGNATWSIISRVVPLAISLFITPFLITHIGTASYGLYMLIMSMTGVMGVMSFGLGDATLRYVAFYHSRADLDGINAVVRSTLFLYIVIGVSVLLAVTLSAPLLVPLFSIPDDAISQAIILLRISSICFAITLLNEVATATIRAVQRYDLQTKVIILAAICQALATIVVIKYSGGLTGLVLVVLNINFFSLILNIMLAKRLLPKIKFSPAYSRAGIKEVTGYGFFSFLTHLLGLSFNYSDRLILGSLVSSTVVGFLTVPQDLALRALSIVGQGGAVLFPRFSATTDPAEIERLYINATWLMLSFSVVIFAPLTIYLKDFVALWISNDFADKCSNVGQLIAFSSMIRGAFVVYQHLFQGMNKPQYVTTIAFLVGVTSLALNVVLIPRYGLAGAGYSYCGTAVWGLFAMIFTWKYVFRKKSSLVLLRIVAIPLVLGCLAVVIGFKLKAVWPPTGWLALGVESTSIALVLAVMVGVCEVIIARNHNCATVCWRSIRQTVARRGSAA